jgi:dihydroorotase
MKKLIIKNATLVNEGKVFSSDILIENERIEKIAISISVKGNADEIDATNLHLFPGVIDDQVHFREPGLTHKANIASESKAAIAGGTTTFMEMPNVNPPTLNLALLEEKYAIAKNSSFANYSFFMGVSNDNYEEAIKANKFKNEICGFKIFMGSSTGNMLVDNIVTLENIFSNAEMLIATHCEREQTITENKLRIENQHPNYGVAFHPIIRNEEACYESSLAAIQLAKKHDTRLHILHISTEEEIQLFTNLFPLEQKRITAEVCVHHLTFTADDYEKLGTQIQCNPAIKNARHQPALWQALLDNKFDIVATDHAPHTWDEKQQPYPKSPSGLPLVQHSLLQMLEHSKKGKISLATMVEKMCHAPAQCYQISERGFLREGYFADLVLVDLNKNYTVTKENILYKCGWSPFENKTFSSSIEKTIVNGNIAFENRMVNENRNVQRVKFVRG